MNRPGSPGAPIVAALAVCTTLAACGGGDSDSRQPDPSINPQGQAGDALVARYCAYGTKTHAAIIECFESTSPFEVRGNRTNAARYALGRGECLADSGPFCR